MSSKLRAPRGPRCGVDSGPQLAGSVHSEAQPAPATGQSQREAAGIGKLCPSYLFLSLSHTHFTSISKPPSPPPPSD